MQNDGTITAGSGASGGAGVILDDDATFTNAVTGTVLAGDGSSDASGGGGIGVILYSGATVTNFGMIAGGWGGGNASGTIAYGGVGVMIGDGSVLVNAAYTYSVSGKVHLPTISGGSFSGGAGVSLGTGATLVNNAIIEGAANGLIGVNNVDAKSGAGITNTGGTAINTGLIIGGAGGNGTYATGIGVSGGAGAVSTGLIINAGTIEGGVGGIGKTDGAAGDAVDGGTLVIDPGAVFIGKVEVTKLVAAGSTASTLNGFGTAFEASAALVFDPGSEWTVEGNASGLGSGQAIDGFAAGETIELDGFSATSHSYLTGIGLELFNATGAVTLDITGNFDSGDFTLTHSDGDTTITTDRLETGSGLLVLTLAAPSEIENSIGQTALIAGISVSEADNAPFEVFTVQVGDTNGLLLDTVAGVSGSGTDEVTISGSIDQVNADLAALNGLNTLAGTNAVSVSVTDGLGNSETSAITVYTHAPPAISVADSTLILNVGQASSIGRPQITVAVAPPDNDIFTVTINTAFGLLNDPVLGLDDMDSGVPSLTFSGSLAAVNDILEAVYDFEATPGTDTISLHVTDGYGATGVSSIAVTVNGLPTITAPGTLTIEAGETTSIRGISISESGNTEGETFDVAIYASDAKGYVALGDDSLEAYEETSGSLEQVNAALATLRAEFFHAGSDALDISVAGGNDVIAQIALTIESPPTITLPSEVGGELAGDIGETLAISGISVTEPGASASDTFTVLLTDAGGTLSATGKGVSGAAINALTLAGSLAQVNADLASLSVLDTAIGQNPIIISVSDSVGGTAVSTFAVYANGSPTISSTEATLSSTAGTPLYLNGVQITGQENPTGDDILHITSETGLLSFNEAGSSVTVAGNDSKILTLTGTQAALNSAFGEVDDTVALPGTDALEIHVTDQYGLTAAASVPVTVSGSPISTLATDVFHGITLASSAFSNILTITETGGVYASAGNGVTALSSVSPAYDLMINAGRITGGAGSQGVGLSAHATLTNAATGLIQGSGTGSGVRLSGLGAVTNLGIIQGGNGISGSGDGHGFTSSPGGVGVFVAGGGVVSNAGVIQGGSGAFGAYGSGNGGVGVYLVGTLSNAGTIQGGTGTGGGEYGAGGAGVFLDFGTLFNAGAISGASNGDGTYEDAVKFGGAGADTLVVEPGATFDGLVVANASFADVLELSADTTVSGVGSEFLNFKGFSFATGTSSTLEGSLAALAAHETISGFAQGDAIILDDYVASSETFVSGVGLELNGGAETLSVNALSGNGGLELSTNGTNTTITAVLGLVQPTLTAPATATIGVGESSAIAGISLSDTGDTTGEIITITLSDTHGLLSATGAGVSGSGTTGLTITGSLAIVNADLATLNDLDATAGVDVITFTGGISTSDIVTELSIANNITIAAGGTGYAAGDVHILTFDGLHYNFQAIGDFVLARATTPGDSFQIQMHTEESLDIPGTSIATKYAAQLGDDQISFTATANGGLDITVNGIADTALSQAGARQVFASGTLTAISATSFKLAWNSGETLSVAAVNESAQSYLNANVSLPSQDGPGSVQGLMGTDSGQANDFKMPDGTVLQQPVPTSELLGQFADAWRVATGTSILDDNNIATIATGPQPTPLEAITFASAAANRQIGVSSNEILTGSAVSSQFGPAPPGVTFTGVLLAFQSDIFANFGLNDVIDITDLKASAVSLKQSSTGSVQLQIDSGGAVATLHFSTNVSDSFQVASDGHGGTMI